MSVESVSRVLNHSRARGTAKLVLVGIANHDGDGGAWPSVATLCRYANVDRRTVQRAIQELVTLGEVVVHTNDGGTRSTRPDQRPNRYEITVAERPRDGAASASPRDADGAAWVTERGGVGDANGAAWTPPEPSFEPSKKEGGARADASPARTASTPPTPKDELGGRPSTAPAPPLAFPERCPAHQTSEYVPPCTACKVARETVAATARARAAAEVEAERQRRRTEAELARREAARCHRCDDHGRAPSGLPCRHDEAEKIADAARRGGELARMALGKK